MYDAVNVSNLPAGGDCYAGYVNGKWPTYAAVRAKYPGLPVLSISVFSAGDADCLDVETGDATAADCPEWVRRQQIRGVHQPVLYTFQSNLGAVMAALNGAGIPRSAVRLWSAHWGAGQHICSPTACRAAATCDGTQWDSNNNYDTSLLVGSFFTAPQTAQPAQPAGQPAPAAEDNVVKLISTPGDLGIYATDGTYRHWIPSQAILKEGIALGVYPSPVTQVSAEFMESLQLIGPAPTP
jgi:hypothetical protein